MCQYVQIIGGNFDNCGDHLMLIAAVTALRNMAPAPRIVSSILGLSTFEDRACLGLYQTIPRVGALRAFRWLGAPILKRYGALYGIIPEQKISAFMDMSGYAYAERWGTAVIRSRFTDFCRWRRQGKKLVMLPQAFGPFESDRMRALVRAVAELADLVFARDQRSFEELVRAGVPEENLAVAPEFTQALRCPERMEGEGEFGDAIALVPNVQMVRQGNVSWSEYLGFCVRAVRAIWAAGFRAVVVQFSRSADKELVDDIYREEPSVIVVRSYDPLYLKWIIGRCFGAICSRYHALVSALSQGVPALATAWSHKYTEFLRDYGVCDNLLCPYDSAEKIRAKVLALLVQNRDRTADHLRKQARKQAEMVYEMWRRVAGVLGLSYCPSQKKTAES